MRTRSSMLLLPSAIAIIAFGPALIAVVSQSIAEGFGCEVDLDRVNPCVIGGTDYGDTFYNLGFAIWYLYLSLPAGGVLFAVWLVATLAMLGAYVMRRRRARPSGEAL